MAGQHGGELGPANPRSASDGGATGRLSRCSGAGGPGGDTRNGGLGATWYGNRRGRRDSLSALGGSAKARERSELVGSLPGAQMLHAGRPARDVSAVPVPDRSRDKQGHD